MDSDRVPVPFPTTLWSEVLALRHQDPERRRERMSKLIDRYWKPVYWAVRAHGGSTEDEARDFTQEFFVRILEGDVVSTVDPDKGSFRHYLRGALRHFLLNEKAREHRLKRGGGQSIVSLDFAAAGPEPAGLGADPAEALDRAWARQILAEALDTLKTKLPGRDAGIFLAYEMSTVVPRPSYEEVAKTFGVTSRDVWNVLRLGRRELREILLERIGHYVRNEGELQDELRELFGS